MITFHTPPRHDPSAGLGPAYSLTSDRPQKLWLPPVAGLPRSSSLPDSPWAAAAAAKAARETEEDWRGGARDWLTEMKALEGCMGVKGSSLLASLESKTTKARLAAAIEDGEPKELRKAIRHAVCRAKLGADPDVQRAQATLSRLEKCCRECRDGFAEGNMLKLHRAVSDVEKLGLGYRVFEDPLLSQARERYYGWKFYMPYLRKLDHALHEGPLECCIAWVEAVEGSILSAEWEDAATAELAGLPGAEEALEEVLSQPRLRLFYPAASFRERNRLLALTQSRLSELGIEVLELRLRAARIDIGDGGDEGVAVVVEGSRAAVEDALRVLREQGGRGEPVAMGHEATLEDDSKCKARLDALRSRLASAAVSASGSGARGGGGSSHDVTLLPPGTRAAARAAAKVRAAAVDETLRPWFAAFPPTTPRLSLLDPKASPPAGRFQPDLKASASSPSLRPSSKGGRPAAKRRTGRC